MTERTKVEKSFRLAARVLGQMAGALARGRLRPDAPASWAQSLRQAAEEMEI